MINVLIGRMLRHAFLTGYEMAKKDKLGMEGSDAWPHYEPNPKDLEKLNAE
jgi:hypothetical protein